MHNHLCNTSVKNRKSVVAFQDVFGVSEYSLLLIEVLLENSTVTLSHQKIETFAPEMATLFKAMSHEGRLKILFHLLGNELSVGALEELLRIRQTAVSQQLARLREDNLVRARREGKSIYYSIADDRIANVLRAGGTVF